MHDFFPSERKRASILTIYSGDDDIKLKKKWVLREVDGESDLKKYINEVL